LRFRGSLNRRDFRIEVGKVPHSDGGFSRDHSEESRLSTISEPFVENGPGFLRFLRKDLKVNGSKLHRLPLAFHPDVHFRNPPILVLHLPDGDHLGNSAESDRSP
jgi:hypothetical protein